MNVNIGSTPLHVHPCLVCVLQPVILKELKQTDGDFSEDQRIELNTVRCSNLPVAARTFNASVTSPVCLFFEENLLIFHSSFFFSPGTFLAAGDRLLQLDQVLRHGEVWVQRVWGVWALSAGLPAGEGLCHDLSYCLGRCCSCYNNREVWEK